MNKYLADEPAANGDLLASIYLLQSTMYSPTINKRPP